MVSASIFGSLAALAALLLEALLSGLLLADTTPSLVLGVGSEELVVFFFLMQLRRFAPRLSAGISAALFALGFTATEMALFLFFQDPAPEALIPFALIALVHLISAALYTLILRTTSHFAPRVVALIGGIAFHSAYNLFVVPILR